MKAATLRVPGGAEGANGKSRRTCLIDIHVPDFKGRNNQEKSPVRRGKMSANQASYASPKIDVVSPNSAERFQRSGRCQGPFVSGLA